MSEAHRTLYFDIDGTLMVARGAGRSAFTQAFEDVYDKLIDISHINFAGATDLGVLQDLLREQELVTTPDQRIRFFERLAFHLETNLKKRPPHLLPGVISFLQRVAPRWSFALVTGNTRACSALKLRYTDLNPYFDIEMGGYGDDDACRNRIAALAIQRTGLPKQGYLLGDTPKDIRAAKSNHLKSVGLCTGAFTRAQLMLEKPDIILDSFEQADDLLVELCA